MATLILPASVNSFNVVSECFGLGMKGHEVRETFDASRHFAVTDVRVTHPSTDQLVALARKLNAPAWAIDTRA